LNKNRCRQINQINQKFPIKITVLIRMTTFEGYVRISAMLNSARESRFMQEFDRFSRILAGYNILPLENKKCSKKIKNVRIFF